MPNLIELIKSGITENKSLVDIYSESNDVVDKIDFYRNVLTLIENGQIPNVLICFCGHDCSKCRTFHATLSNDNNMRKNIIEYYRSEFKQDIPIDKLYCLSGRSDVIMEGCRDCPFMKCCRGKNLQACSECTQYPCQMLDIYIKTYVNKSNQIKCQGEVP